MIILLFVLDLYRWKRYGQHVEVRTDNGGLREVSQLSCRDSAHPWECPGGRLEAYCLPWVLKWYHKLFYRFFLVSEYTFIETPSDFHTCLIFYFYLYIIFSTWPSDHLNQLITNHILSSPRLISTTLFPANTLFSCYCKLHTYDFVAFRIYVYIIKPT